MKGRTCLVTGGTSGVGKAAAAGLAELGATVLIVGRDVEKGRRALEEIRRRSGSRDVDLLCADLSGQSAVRGLARAVEARFGALHVLVNAAGVLNPMRKRSVDGAQMTLAVDYTCHFLLTNLLLEALKKGAPSRIVTVAGAPCFLKMMRPRFETAVPSIPSGPLGAAMWAAAARFVFALELARRLEGTGVTSNAFHPGPVRSDLGRSLPLFLRVPYRLAQPFLKETCGAAVYLASSPEAEGVNGRYFAGRSFVEPARFGYPPRAGMRLWRYSEALTGL